MNRLVQAFALLAVCMLPACETTSSNSNRNVMDITWGRNGGAYQARYDRGQDRYQDLRQRVSRYDEDYYKRNTRMTTAAGEAVKPINQIEFKDEVAANVRADSVDLGGVKGKAKPDTAIFYDSEGKEVRLDSYKGKIVVLVFTRGFSGYICPMCTTYTAQISRRYDEFVKNNAEVLLVYPGAEDTLDEFVYACNEIAESDASQLKFPVLMDRDLKAVSRFNIKGDLSLPATYIFDANGVNKWGYVGKEPNDRPSAKRVLEEVRKLRKTQ